MRFWMPEGLAERFAVASAALAAVAVLLVSLASWWLIQHEQALADHALAERERQFHADNVGSTLGALSSRMSEVAGSTILATGLVDSVGKETYLAPYLNGIRQINGIPVQVLFTDFEGVEIASNGIGTFSPEELAWVRRQLLAGRPAAQVIGDSAAAQLVALEPLRYERTSTPEGAVVYKVSIRDIRVEPGLRLAWGPLPAASGHDAAAVRGPAVFAPLQFRVEGRIGSRPPGPLQPRYLAIVPIAAAIFFVVFLAGSRLARLLTRDLSRLEAFSSKVTTAAVITQRAPEGGTREVASLAASINRMLERLHEQHEALRSEGEKLGRLAEALQVADRRKDEFLAMLAHELRNPLAPISTGAELLRRTCGDEPATLRTVDVIARQVRHMRKLVDDLLDVSRVTRGLVVLERAAVDARTVVAAAVDQVRPLAEARRHRLEADLPVRPLPLVGDAARLVQVVSNLLHNACKFTPDGGHIRVSGRHEGAHVVLQVADNGSGIGPEFLPEVFGLFTQGSRTPDRSQGGLGLGLALVKHLVELHGGRVWVESAGLGQGAAFVVTLPAGDMEDRTPEHEPPSQGMSADALAIMIVDDNVDAAQTLAGLLELQGHDVITLYDPVQALARAAEVERDVFILDIGLPGMDGTELARRIQGLPGKDGAVLIALTGYGQQEDRRRSAEAGFDHHLTKPVQVDALENLLAGMRRQGRRGLRPRPPETTGTP